MSHNLLILGNGFDLDIGYKTRYADFVNSSFWPFKTKELSMIGYPTLQNFFIDYTEEHKDELGKVRWIDIEQLLKDYALSKNKEDSFNNDIVQNDRKCFDLLVNSFAGYLKEQLFNACETHLAED